METRPTAKHDACVIKVKLIYSGKSINELVSISISMALKQFQDLTSV